jgi:enoyl-CoA hydratase
MRVRVDDLDLNMFRISREGDILKIVLDRPDSELNAVNGAVHEELATLFQILKRESEARAVVLTARGTAFSAGGDFNWFPQLQNMGELYRTMLDAKQLVWDLLDLDVPIVAAVNGHAMGLGATIALLCDIIIMAEDARIGDPHVRVGIVAGDGGAAIWPLVVGPARAKQYLLTGDALTAAEAVALGLVNKAVPRAEVETTAMEFATRLAAAAPLAVRFTKRSVNKLVKEALNVAFDTSTALEMVTFMTQDHQEALDALSDKRPPIFQGR